jgi:hypothetical protein
VKAIAKRLCFLYLGRDDSDEILLEDVFLRVPGKVDAEVHWKGGVNYFSAQGDQRWWHDHRIPAGMAFSINSVGHLVKSFQVGCSMEEAWKKLGMTEEGWRDFKIGSLGQALIYAMQTINGAADSISGKATELLRLDRQGANPDKLKCPIDLPKNLEGKNFCEYHGYYHTDITLPSEYFLPAVERPRNISGHMLDFTYLFNDDVENPAFSEMGRGIRVRRLLRSGKAQARRRRAKLSRMFGVEGLISEHKSLKEALEGTSGDSGRESKGSRHLLE